ncbi:MAG: sensor histidine kinase [Chloroflexota bacterium]
MEASKLEKYRRRMLIIPVVTGILLFTLVLVYFNYESRRADNQSYKDLKAVGKLKATQISSWYSERSHDAAFYSTSETLLGELQKYTKTGHLNREKLLKLFRPTLTEGVYEEILITDINGRLLFSVNPEYSLSEDNIFKNLINTIITQKITNINLHYCQFHKEIHNDIMAPVMVSQVMTGILVMRINPENFIFPYIQEWPVASKTAETILAARDGDSVVFLNQMKKVPNTALKYKLPLTDTIVPAVAAVSGKRGMFAGRDYAGDAVLSDLSKVKDTPWFLVCKMDKSEINDEVIYRTSMFTGIVLLIIGFITGVLVLSYRKNQQIYLRLSDNQNHERFTAELNMLVDKRTQELKKMNEDLLTFSHVISHDLREPVRKIRFLISLIKNSPRETGREEQINYLKRIEISTNRLNELIDGIHNYAEVQDTTYELHEIDLNECIKQVLCDLELLIEAKQARVTVSTLPKIEGIDILIYKMFYNLIDNALKFTRPGAPPAINITCSQTEQEGKKYVEILISDNGIGFEEEYSHRIFELFKRLNTKDTYEGAGLGLTLCREIARRHNGTISAHGSCDAGATFHVILPVKRGEVIPYRTTVTLPFIGEVNPRRNTYDGTS